MRLRKRRKGVERDRRGQRGGGRIRRKKREEEKKNRALKAVEEARGQMQVGTPKGTVVLSSVENGKW